MASINYPRLLGRLMNRALLITPQKATELLAVLAPRAGLRGQLVRPQAMEDDEAGGPVMIHSLAVSDWGGEAPRKLFQIVDGLAVIPVEGILVDKLGTLEPWCGMTGYDGLAVKLDAAAADPEVAGILFDINSPGGEVSGLFDFVDQVWAARQAKPVRAALSDQACSAAYAIASQCERISIPRTGQIGSVGVVCLHADFSKALDEMGITVTLIHAGAHKVDGNPYQPLPDDVRGDIQAECEEIRAMFVAAVARGRGIEAKEVMATEARVYMGQAGVEVKFADDVAAPQAAFEAFRDQRAGHPGAPAAQAATRTQGGIMSVADRAALKPAAEENPDKKRPEDEEDEDKNKEKKEPAAGKDNGAAAAADPRVRIAAILNAPEAKGREALAKHLALETDLAAEAAVKTLAAAPKESAAGDAFAKAMAANAGPDLGTESETEARRTAGLHAAVAEQAKRAGLKIEEVK